MNQILFSKFNQEIEKEENKKRKKMLIIFKYQLIISITVAIICIGFYMYKLYTNRQKENISRQLLSNFNINLLYNDASEYNTSMVEVAESENDSFIIGLIEIKKLKIIYPILSEVSDELLKIAACRFYGPLPNQTGNLCIAAHNYNDSTFFSKIHLLEMGDTINIYDVNGNMQKYSVTEKYTITATDTNCTNQNTNNQKQITLLTCNNITGHRLVVKATAL